MSFFHLIFFSALPAEMATLSKKPVVVQKLDDKALQTLQEEVDRGLDKLGSTAAEINRRAKTETQGSSRMIGAVDKYEEEFHKISEGKSVNKCRLRCSVLKKELDQFKRLLDQEDIVPPNLEDLRRRFDDQLRKYQEDFDDARNHLEAERDTLAKENQRLKNQAGDAEDLKQQVKELEEDLQKAEDDAKKFKDERVM